MATESVKNYYEHLVIEEIYQQFGSSQDDNFISDVACIALNHLPPRYYRYDVDMAYYLSPIERQESVDKVKLAVKNAVEFMKQSQRSN